MNATCKGHFSPCFLFFLSLFLFTMPPAGSATNYTGTPGSDGADAISATSDGSDGGNGQPPAPAPASIAAGDTVTGGDGGDGLRDPSDNQIYSAGGDGGRGGDGLSLSTTTVISRDVTITGGKGGGGGDSYSLGGMAGYASSGTGGDGGVGIGAGSNNVTVSEGTVVSGGNGGSGGTSRDNVTGGTVGANDGRGGNGGAGIAGSNISIEVRGTIRGGNGGQGGSSMAYEGGGGAGIEGRDLTIVGHGTIAGGVGQGDKVAIRFTGGSNTLELHPGSTMDGKIEKTGAAAVDLVLGGAGQGTLDIGSNQYNGVFSNHRKTGNSTWTLTGDDNQSNWTVDNGTLIVDGAVNTLALVTAGNATITGTGTVANFDAGSGAGTLTLEPGATITALSSPTGPPRGNACVGRCRGLGQPGSRLIWRQVLGL